MNSETEVTPVTGGTAGYTLNIKLTFQYKKIERGRPRRKKDENLNINQEQLIRVAIYSRFNIQREYYPALHTVMFQPSPFFYETYGSYFPRLPQARTSVLTSNLPLEIKQRYYTAAVENMPHFTLLLQHVNLPLYIFSKNMHAVHSHLEPPRIKKMTNNRGSQTEEQQNNITDVWKYKEIIGNLKPIWSDFKTPSYDSICGNSQLINVDFTLDNFVADDKQLLEACSITELKDELATNAISEPIIIHTDHLQSLELKEIKKESIDLPTSTVADKEYDVQWPKWGYQKAVTKKRGKKKNQTVFLYKDVLLGTKSTKVVPPYPQIRVKPEYVQAVFSNNTGTNGESTLLAENSPSYATVTKSPRKVEKNNFEYSDETRARVYETYKDDPDFLWFEGQFPDVQSSVPLTKTQMSERFEIAEEFIREDMERENNRKGKKRLAI